MLALVIALAMGAATAPDAGSAHRFAVSVAGEGPRPAASARERRAQLRIARRFRAAGLDVEMPGFRVPGRGRSRNVIGIVDGPSRCLRIVMAHADGVPDGPGANDNASGLGALIALAASFGSLRPGGGRELAKFSRPPRCRTWFVATGAEERVYTGARDHLGALALARLVRRRGLARTLDFALSLDEVGRGRRFLLRSPAGAPRAGVERTLLAAARRARVPVSWRRDASTGNSDHREFELARMPGMKLGVPDDPCRHTACDRPGRLERAAFARVLAVVSRVL